MMKPAAKSVMRSSAPLQERREGGMRGGSGGWQPRALPGSAAPRHPCASSSFSPRGRGLSQHHPLLHILHALPLAARPRGLHPADQAAACVGQGQRAAAAQAGRGAGRQQADPRQQLRHIKRVGHRGAAGSQGAGPAWGAGRRRGWGSKVGAAQGSRRGGRGGGVQGAAALPPPPTPLPAAWVVQPPCVPPLAPPELLGGWRALPVALQGEGRLVLEGGQGGRPSKG